MQIFCTVNSFVTKGKAMHKMFTPLFTPKTKKLWQVLKQYSEKTKLTRMEMLPSIFVLLRTGGSAIFPPV